MRPDPTSTRFATVNDWPRVHPAVIDGLLDGLIISAAVIGFVLSGLAYEGPVRWDDHVTVVAFFSATLAMLCICGFPVWWAIDKLMG